MMRHEVLNILQRQSDTAILYDTAADITCFTDSAETAELQIAR
jgi:hypothetical protein